MTKEMVRCGHSILQTHRFEGSDRDHVAKLLEYFAPPAGAHVLDAGCGVGIVAEIMKDLRPDLTFTLLNISAAQLDLAADGPVKIVGDFQSIPVENGSYDAVMFLFSLGHGLLSRSIAEVSRVLRSGGVLFIYDLSADKASHDHVIDRVGYRPHSPDEVRAAALECGFTHPMKIENPPVNANAFIALFGADEMARTGIDRTQPTFYRFQKT